MVTCIKKVPFPGGNETFLCENLLFASSIIVASMSIPTICKLESLAINISGNVPGPVPIPRFVPG